MENLQIIGRVGQNAQVKKLDSGKYMLTVSVAATKRWRDKQGNKQERTTWYSCYAYHNESPKVSSYLTKGSLVCVAGEPGISKYVTTAGEHKAEFSLLIESLELLDSTKTREEDAVEKATNRSPISENLPF